jgi:DNA-binding response OmpR family regulator
LLALCITGRDQVFAKSLEREILLREPKWWLKWLSTATQVDSSNFDAALVLFDQDYESNIKRCALPTLLLDYHGVREEIDEMMALRMGADCIGKWQSTSVVIERVRALVRRCRLDFALFTEALPIIERNNLIIDLNRNTVIYLEQVLDLTVTEMRMLSSLVKIPGHILNRDQLMIAAYSQRIYIDVRTIDSHIKRIRAKFKAINPNFKSIKTMYGVGYCYEEEKAEAITTAQCAAG